MQCHSGRMNALGTPLGLVLFVFVMSATVSAQPAPTQGPLESPPTPSPALSPTAVPPTAVGSGGASREAQLEARIRQLESIVNQLSTQVQQLRPAAPAGGTTAGGTTAGGAAPSRTAGPDVGSAASMLAPSARGGAAAPGQSLPPNPPPSARFDSPATLEDLKAKIKFGPGFEIKTEDDEFILQFHNLTQFDYRGYQQGGQTLVKNGFLFPRQWWMFSGRLTRGIGFFTSIANSFDTLSLLDVFADVDLDPRFRVRAGRFKTPFTYEFFVEPIQGLVVPERSIFFNNFAQNRDLGIMPYGRLFNDKVDYGVGIFNGTRNGFIPNQNGKVISGLINYRPFGNEENTFLENFNIGGSLFAGEMDQAPIPQVLRTVVPTSGNSVAGIPFLIFNNNVRQSGPMAFWDLHLAYFYQQLAVIGEWGSGYQNYAFANTLRDRIQLPVQSYYIQASYLLTGETRSSIGIVKPKKPVRFGAGTGSSGIGAIEPYIRYEYMDIGSQVFTRGLADPNLWANRLFVTRLGLNWHLTQYIKMYFEWGHDEFNKPVFFAPGRRQLTSDLFLVRFQLFF